MQAFGKLRLRPNQATVALYEQIKAGVWLPTPPDQRSPDPLSVIPNGYTALTVQATPAQANVITSQPVVALVTCPPTQKQQFN